MSRRYELTAMLFSCPLTKETKDAMKRRIVKLLEDGTGVAPHSRLGLALFAFQHKIKKAQTKEATTLIKCFEKCKNYWTKDELQRAEVGIEEHFSNDE